MSTVAAVLNTACKGRSPSSVAFCAVGAAGAAVVLVRIFDAGCLHQRGARAVFRVVRCLLRPFIQREIDKASASIVFQHGEAYGITDAVPEEGVESTKLVELTSRMHADMDVDYRTGAFSGTVYHGQEDHTKLMNTVMSAYQWSNPLHVDAFPSVRKVESEICAMVVRLYNGGPDACAAVTSGGTESIGMAVKVYRDWGRAVLNIRYPTIVLPVTAHPAFDKAAHYYGVRTIKVPVGPSGAVNVKELERYIRYDTVAIVGSAPTFSSGTYDDIVALGAVATKYGIGLHVDACLGGFINPFLARAGFDQPIVDFRAAGVTTISCDTHKYGFAPKGTSVIMYANPDLRKFQFFTEAGWPGGIYCSPGAPGSRAGNVIVASWVAMVNMGMDGYTKCCREIVGATRAIQTAVNAHPSLHVLGTPRGSVVSFSAKDFDIFELHSRMRKRGWHLNPLQFPSGVQISVTLLHAQPDILRRLLADLEIVANELRSEGKSGPSKGASMYGSQQRIPDRSIVEDIMVSYLNGYYSHGKTEKSPVNPK